MIYNGHEDLLDDIPYTLRYTTAALRPHKTRFDFLAVTGMSGVVIGSPLAVRLEKPLVIIRKEGDSSHSYGDLIGAAACKGRYVFVDDFIASGGTYRRVRERLASPELDTRYVGAYLYSDKLLSWDGDGKIKYRPRRKTDQVDVTYDDAEPVRKPVSPLRQAVMEYTAAERYGALDALRGLLMPPLSPPPPTLMTRVA